MYSKITTKVSVVAGMMLMFFSTAAFSQTTRFSVSINSLITNFNYGKSNSSLEPFKKNFRGLQAGFSYQVGITPMFSVVPEIYFGIKGGSLKEGNPITLNKLTVKTYSLEMPVLARLHCNNLYINAGPYAGYNLGGRMKIGGSDITPETTTKVSFGKDETDFKRWDFGFLAGAGYNFNLKRSVLTLDVRYGYGLTNISKDVERYNRLLKISVVISKPNKKKKPGKVG